MPFGPRLDRPSAVGDEGRPRATSLGVATAVVLAVVVGAGFALGDPGFVSGFGLLVGVTVAGMALVKRERVRDRVVGHLLFLPGASLLAVVPFVSSNPPLVVAGTAAAVAGVGGAWADVGDGQSVRGVLKTGVLSYVFGLICLTVGAVSLGVAVAFWNVATGLAGGPRPGWALAGMAFVVAVVALCLRVALRAVPVVELAPRDLTEAVAYRVTRVGRRLVVVFAGAFLLTWLFGTLAATGQFRGAAGPATVAVEAVTSQVVVVPLVLVGGVALCAAGLAVVGRRATTEYDPSTSRTVAAAVAGVGYVVVLALLVLSAGFFPLAAVLVVFAAVALPLVVFFALLVAVVAIAGDVLPDDGAPLALAAMGLLAVAVGAASVGPPGALAFGATAGALVVWDVGTFGLGVTAELGHQPDTRRLELYHGVFAVGVGVAAVAAAVTLDALLQPVGSAVGTPAAMAVAAVGVFLLLVSLRG